ncbi:hypothetical protein F8388_027348 [Cannabis sativa]|uniref:GH18 domain-containing protein n=1 Tax=Cannabis sativa TaxID=3483 RepID=A0A7J6E819_CANSA|nr:hypothetical protein F8388_027348 [Cannabis sativa]
MASIDQKKTSPLLNFPGHFPPTHHLISPNDNKSCVIGSLRAILFCAFASTQPPKLPNSHSIPKCPKVLNFHLHSPHAETPTSNPPLLGGGAADKTGLRCHGFRLEPPSSFHQILHKLSQIQQLPWPRPRLGVPFHTDQMTQFGYLVGRVALRRRRRGSEHGRIAASSSSSDTKPVPEYVVLALSRSLDWINVMSYDFYAPGWSTRDRTSGSYCTIREGRSARFRPQGWIQAGFPANKIVLGVPFYGYGWTLSNPSNTGYFAPTTGAAFRTRSKTYQQIKKFIAANRADGGDLFGFDAIQSIRTKVKYIKDNRLRGYFAWHVGGDDNMALSRTASQALDQQGAVRAN